jgi:hypothetical protein
MDAPTGSNKATLASKRLASTTKVGADDMHGTHSNDGKTIGSKRHRSDLDDADRTVPGAVKLAQATQGQQPSQAKVPGNTSRGRPQRQAKQTALGKLKAKHIDTDSEADDDLTDDSRGDNPNFVVQSKSVKKASDGCRKPQQLPTPVTNSNPSKQLAGKKSQGKLKSVKPQQSTTPAAEKKLRNDTAAPPAPSAPVGNPSDTVAQTKKQQKTGVEPQRSPTAHPTTGSLIASRREQRESIDEQSQKRPGALKRPARSHLRRRQPHKDTLYEFPESTPGTRKKGQSTSRASKSVAAKPGPTRQKMQSESVKQRLDRVNEDLQRVSVSRQPSPQLTKAADPPRKRSEAKREHEGSQPPAISPERQNARQNDTSTQSRHAPDAALHNLKTGSRPMASQQKPGSSQAHAITVEQDSQSDSSSSSSPRRPMKIQAKANGQVAAQCNDNGRPRTPAITPSSPLGSGRQSNYTTANNKPTIIAFSRHGPRNQGFSSARKVPGSAASSKAVSDYNPAKAGTPGDYANASGLARQLFPPKSQHEIGVQKQVTHTAEPREVSKGEDNVFGGFIRNGKNKALVSLLQESSMGVEEPRQEYQDTGFSVIGDFEGTTLINDDDQPTNDQPTASQIAMPPPNVVTKEKKKPKAVDATVRFPAKPMMKPAATKDTPRPARAKKAASVSIATNDQDAVRATRSSARNTKPVKDGADGPELLKKVTKALSANSAPEPKRLKEQTAAQLNQQVRKRKSIEPPAGSPSKKTRVPQENAVPVPTLRLMQIQEASESQPLQITDTVKRVDRRKSRLNRRTTQGSQGVDILGSPYPKAMDVPQQTTALEVFSQQTGLSSDMVVSSDADMPIRLDLKAVPRLVPQTKAGLGASNGKTIPTAPDASSKVLTRIASGPLAEQLLAVRPVYESGINPFTRSRVREQTDAHEISMTRFKEALRQHGIEFNDQPPADQHDGQEDEQEDMQDEDAEKTLVEPTNEPVKTSIPSSPVASVTSTASSPNAASKALEDVGDWRTTLKPHQTHLFDSLVIAAHKLVRHMVDHETANNTIVADYRRRGEIIVSELQSAHAKEYQHYLQNMQERKRKAADELAAHGRRLKQVMREAEKARAERKRAVLARGEFDRELEGLVAGLE